MHARAERGDDPDERWAAEFVVPKPAPSRLKPVPLTAARAASGTGVSREWTQSVLRCMPTQSVGTINCLSGPGFNRRKTRRSVGPALAGKLLLCL
jgi:hypothetical protein